MKRYFYIKDLCISIILVMISCTISAQEFYTSDNCKDRSGFAYGAVGGFYIASNKSADFYSGKASNENNVDYIFNNQHWYNEIKHLLDFYDTAFVLEYPQKMKYSPAFSFGLFVNYNLNCNTGVYLQFSYVKLNLNDVVTIEVDPKDYLTEPDIRICNIKGVEERNMVDLGFSHAIGLNKSARFTFGGGISMNNTLVEESSINLGGKKFSMVNVYGRRPYVPGSNQQQYEIRQGGIGFGIFGTAGVMLEFNPSISIEPGITTYLKQINIQPGSGLSPQVNIYVKVIFRDLLNF